MIELINKGSGQKSSRSLPQSERMCKKEAFKGHHQDTYGLSDEV